MKIDLEITGGLFNLNRKGRLANNEIPASLAHKVHTLIDNDSFKLFENCLEIDEMPDAQIYILKIQDEAFVKQYRMNESTLSVEILDLIDEIASLI